MNFNFKAPITSVAAGAADWGLEYWDAKSGRGAKPFQNATDIGRAVMAVGGYGVAWLMPRSGFAEYAEVVGDVGTALLTKSIISALTKKTFKNKVGYGANPMLQMKAIQARTVSLDTYAPMSNPQPIDTGVSTPIVQPQSLFSSRGDLG